MPPTIVLRRVSCRDCEDLGSNYEGLEGHGSDCYEIFRYRCKNPKVDVFNNRISESLCTPKWCPYLKGEK